MDWYAWLCRAGLHPDVALDYALLFARNELGADDVRHLDHDFLATMGVAVAKHRLEILKLARKESSSHRAAAAITALPWRATRLLAAAVHRSALSALGRLRASVSCSSRRPPRGGLDRRGSRAGGGAAHHPLATPRRLPLHRGAGRAAHGWGKIAAASPVAIRAGKLMALAHVGTPVLLTNSRADKWWSNNGATVKALPAPAGFLAGTEACSCDVEDDGDDPDDGAGEEEMRWESMFEDLKPT